jgi:lysine 2,3-aminomutase
MDPWQQQLNQSLSDPLQLANELELDVGVVRAVAEKYPVRLTSYLLEQMAGAGTPLRRQFVPDESELAHDSLPEDPLAEAEKSPVPAVVHRYPERVLLLAANSCAAYCRFCTRKRRVGNSEQSLSFGQILDGIEYIAGQSQINEVILSGGDPLTMSDGLLRELLDRLRKICHVNVLRIATRMPAVLPERITPQLADLLGRYQPLYVTTHFNHPMELTPAAAEACISLADAGIPLANQAVLLRGVNDDLDSLAGLCTGLLRLRVRPYCLHQMDPTRGTGHFRVSLTKGLELMAGLRKRVSGLAMPHFIVDTPGGHGKVELVPDNILARGDERWVLRAPDGSSVTVET